MFKFLKEWYQTIFVGIIFIIYFVIGFTYLWNMDHNTVKYDCRLSEISPDFPPEVREACRKMRAKNI